MVIKAGGKELAVVNLMGRTFLPPLDDPFRKADEIIGQLSKKHKCILVDFHAEATSEKIAMGWYLDGRASLVVGTHTHVQSNDDTILPQGTAYLTDAGMVGSREGILGMERTAVLRKFTTQLPVRFQVCEGKWHFHAVFVELDEATGRALKIEKSVCSKTSGGWIETGRSRPPKVQQGKKKELFELSRICSK